MEDLAEKYGSSFSDYLAEFNTITADNELGRDDYADYYEDLGKLEVFNEILKAKNAEGANITNGFIANDDMPKELQLYQNYLMQSYAETNDVDYMWMAFEVSKQYADYTNGKEPTSIFQVDENGKFFTEANSNVSNIDVSEFINKMLDTFIEELSNGKK